MNEQILQAITELISQGGKTAYLWIVFHYGTIMLKFVVGAGLVIYALKHFIKIIRWGLEMDKHNGQR